MSVPRMTDEAVTRIRAELVQQVDRERRRHQEAIGQQRPSSPRRRLRLVVLAAAVTVALPASVLAVQLGGRSVPAERVLYLSASTLVGGACSPLNESVGYLRTADTAFSARVVSVSNDDRNGTVVLRPVEFFRGGAYDEVQLQRPPVEGDFPLDPGDSVLIAADDNTIRGCGLSGSISPELQHYYAEAFKGA